MERRSGIRLLRELEFLEGVQDVVEDFDAFGIPSCGAPLDDGEVVVPCIDTGHAEGDRFAGLVREDGDSAQAHGGDRAGGQGSGAGGGGVAAVDDVLADVGEGGFLELFEGEVGRFLDKMDGDILAAGGIAHGEAEVGEFPGGGGPAWRNGEEGAIEDGGGIVPGGGRFGSGGRFLDRVGLFEFGKVGDVGNGGGRILGGGHGGLEGDESEDAHDADEDDGEVGEEGAFDLGPVFEEDDDGDGGDEEAQTS